jgi:preprotein translocase subunit SecE
MVVKKVLKYLEEVRFEMTKVIWPKRNEVVGLTVTVILISLIVGTYLGALDYVFTKLLEILVLV